MRKSLVVALLAALGLPFGAGAALSQTGPDSTPREQGAIFTELPDGTVRHEPSGMECPPTIGEFRREAVEVLDQAQLGRDVSCDYQTHFDGRLGKLTLFITDWGQDVPAEEALRGTMYAILHRNPGAQLYGEKTPSLVNDRIGFHPIGAAVLISVDNEPHVTGAWIQNRLGWSQKLRLTTPEEAWQTQWLIANTGMMLVFETITKEARP